MSLEWTAQGSYINYFDGFFSVEHMDRISYQNKFCKKNQLLKKNERIWLQ